MFLVVSSNCFNNRSEVDSPELETQLFFSASKQRPWSKSSWTVSIFRKYSRCCCQFATYGILYYVFWGVRECESFFFEDLSFRDQVFKKLPEASSSQSTSSFLLVHLRPHFGSAHHIFKGHTKEWIIFTCLETEAFLKLMVSSWLTVSIIQMIHF